MKSGLAVIGFLILVACIAAYFLASKYGPELTRTQDLVTGLIYFIEENHGQFPASEEEFRAAPFVEKTPDGIRIRPKPNTRFRADTHGVVIGDLKPYGIAWGTDLSKVQIDDRGRVRNEKGVEVKLVTWPSSPPSGRSYSWVLLDVYEQVTAATSQPASAAAASGPAAP